MSMIIGIAASRVRRPSISRMPQPASKAASNGDMTYGAGRPISEKRPGPRVSGNTNFMIASQRKTAPTINRIRVVTGGAESGGCSIQCRSRFIVRIMSILTSER